MLKRVTQTKQNPFRRAKNTFQYFGFYNSVVGIQIIVQTKKVIKIRGLTMNR